MPRTKAVLFDLDGTLLPIDTDAFVHEYFRLLAKHMAHLIPPADLAQHVMASTEAMIRNTDANVTNWDAFFQDFIPRVRQEPEVLRPVFDQFYAEQFPTLKERCMNGDPAGGRRAVEKALELGYQVVLATNPLFPRAAIWERMRWAGVDQYPWQLITCLEEMHYCKPQPGFYQEVLARIGYQPDECLMVGNDVLEDGIAARVGIPVYLVTDYLINRTGAPVPEPHGTLAEFPDWLERSQA